MEQFKKWQKNRPVKTIGYLNNSSAYKAGEENGWREALEWFKSEIDRCHAGNDVIDMIFEDELK